MFCHRALRGGLRGRAGGIGLCTKTAAAPSSSPPSALARLSRLPKRHPFALAVGLTCCKTAAADIMTQRFIEGKEELDWRRTAIFAAFGTCYLGAFQYALLTKLVPRLLPGVAAFIDKPVRAHPLLAARFAPSSRPPLTPPPPPPRTFPALGRSSAPSSRTAWGCATWGCSCWSSPS